MPLHFKLRPIASAILLLYTGTGAIAAETPTDTQLPEVTVTATGQGQGDYKADTATTATKIEAPLRDIPQTVNVVPKALIRDQGARSLQEVLRNVPGVGFSNGDGQRDQVTIRGFSAISDQFIDGIRDDALFFRDLADIEQVEVLKGPAAVLYGRGSSGGIINRVTKKPRAEPFAEATGIFGSFDTKRGEVDLNHPIGGANFRLNASVEDSGGFRDQFFLERHLIAPSLALAPSADTRLLFQIEHLKDRRLDDFGIPAINGKPADVPIDTYYGSANGRQDDFVQSEVTAGTFTLDHRFNERWRLRNAFRYYDYDLDRNNTVATSVTAGANPKVNRRHGVIKRQEQGFFNQTDFITDAEGLGLKHKLLFGVEVGRQDKDGKFGNFAVNPPAVSLFNPVLTPLTPSKIVNTTDNTGISTVVALYGQDLVSLSEHWKALLGLRYDWFEQDADDHLTRTSFGRIDREFSPRAGLVYQPSDWASLYASYSQSFQPSQESFTLAANAADIAPEETRNYEVGAKLDFLGGAISSTFSLFRLERTNIKTTDLANPSKLIPVGEQRTDGFEATVAGRPAVGWEVSAGYAYLDGRITQSTSKLSGVPIQGNRSSLTPVHSANLWLTHRFTNGFGIGGGLVYSDDYFASPSNVVKLDDYVRGDATVFYEAKAYEVRLLVNNISDERYFESAHGGADLFNTPGAPRNALVTLRFKF